MTGLGGTLTLTALTTYIEPADLLVDKLAYAKLQALT